MLYTDANEIRGRMNELGVILNKATDYSRRELPTEYADHRREWLELADVWHDLRNMSNGGVEIARAGNN